MPGQRPLDMFADYGIAFVPPRFERDDDVRRGRRIAQCNGDITQPALVAAAPDRRAFGPAQESCSLQA